MGLGRGFSSLIPTDLIDESLDPTAAQDHRLSDLRELKLELIEANPDQPRRSFDEEALEAMAESIAHHGVIQPIVVTPFGEKYQIVAGERRFRSAGRAGLETIPAIIRTLSDQNKLELSLIENIQRRDLNILETATAYLKLRDQFSLSLEEIGARVGGRSASSISNILRLLRLPESVRNALHDEKLREGQARPLIGADPELIEAILPQIIREEWSARKIEQFIIDLKKAKKANTEKSESKGPQHDDTVQVLAKRFAAKIQIRSNTKGAGKIVISFTSDNDFERITKLLEKE
ncbi:MAG: parB [Candidatus Saccharibacteria bacterium]|nr:parB [Candidatus Saccharibacteria bacterium]